MKFKWPKPRSKRKILSDLKKALSRKPGQIRPNKPITMDDMLCPKVRKAKSRMAIMKKRRLIVLGVLDVDSDASVALVPAACKVTVGMVYDWKLISLLGMFATTKAETERNLKMVLRNAIAVETANKCHKERKA